MHEWIQSNMLSKLKCALFRWFVLVSNKSNLMKWLCYVQQISLHLRPASLLYQPSHVWKHVHCHVDKMRCATSCCQETWLVYYRPSKGQFQVIPRLTYFHSAIHARISNWQAHWNASLHVPKIVCARVFSLSSHSFNLFFSKRAMKNIKW